MTTHDIETAYENPAPVAAAPSQTVPRRRRGWTILAVCAGLALSAAGTVAVGVRGGSYMPLRFTSTEVSESAPAPQLEKKLAGLAPRGVYVLVDTYRNQLRVVKNGEQIHEAVCSTGSGVILRHPTDGREWIFDTPRGERQVHRKVRDPVWYKPDWAFVEEGVEPPSKASARIDDMSLGDYGLYLGDGYIIHGTLFQSLLGRPITHGCIRLGDADLEYVYKNVPLGARVYLY